MTLKYRGFRFTLFIAYVLLLLPIIFSIFYAVPASDDFAFGCFVSSKNVFVNAFMYAANAYKNYSGRWLLFIIQKITCPLNLGIHLGHMYGIIMIALFMLFTWIIKVSIENILEVIFDGNEKIKIITFLTLSLLLSTYYYVEVYNWFIGCTAYALPLSLTLLTYVYTIKYFDNHSNKNLILLLLIGTIPATNEFCCIPLGIVYLYLFLKRYDRFNSKVKMLVPLIYFIFMGATVVFAPGNFARQDHYSVKGSLTRSALQAVINIVTRIKDMIVFHPLAVVILLLLVFMGMMVKKKAKYNIIEVLIVMGIGIFGSIYPYCYGRGFTNTYMDNRMYYGMDYYLMISMAFLAVMIGQYLSIKFELSFDKKSIFKWSVGLLLFAYAIIVPQNNYLKIVQVDILKNKDLIKESYTLWDGILLELEQSDDSNIVINRENELEWTPYFLYSGVPNDTVYNVPSDTIYSLKQIMINVYYHKESLQIHYDNPLSIN